jgi:hypothetical protein
LAGTLRGDQEATSQGSGRLMSDTTFTHAEQFPCLRWQSPGCPGWACRLLPPGVAALTRRVKAEIKAQKWSAGAARFPLPTSNLRNHILHNVLRHFSGETASARICSCFLAT